MSQATATKWVIDPSHSLVEFSVKHVMIATVRGRFGTFEGTVTGNIDDLSGGKVEVSIDTASVDTRDAKRDEHLRSADFFNSEKHPKMTFVSTNITKTGDGEYDVEGDLTIGEVTKPVTLKAEFQGTAKDPWGGTRSAFEATTTINRKDFNLTWNAPLETGGVLVGDKVKITIEVELIAQ